MKLIIKNKVGSILAALLQSKKIVITLLLLVISFFIAVFTIPDKPTTFDSLMGIVKTISLPVLYLIYQIIDVLQYVKKTTIEAQTNSIGINTGNLFGNASSSVIFSQIDSIHTVQNFMSQLLNISHLTISQTDGTVFSLWGFDPKEAKEFVKNISDKIHVAVKTV